MKRHLAALGLAAFALLGLQRIPCLLGATAATLRAAAAELPPCHRPPASRDEERPAPCSQCASLHRLVSAPGAADPGTAPSLLAHAVPAWRPLAAATPRPTPVDRAAGRAPDPLRTSTVRLL